MVLPNSTTQQLPNSTIFTRFTVLPNSTIPQFHNSTSLHDSRFTTHDSWSFPTQQLNNSPTQHPLRIHGPSQFHNSTFLPNPRSFPTQQLNNSPTQHPLRIHDSRYFQDRLQRIYRLATERKLISSSHRVSWAN